MQKNGRLSLYIASILQVGLIVSRDVGCSYGEREAGKQTTTMSECASTKGPLFTLPQRSDDAGHQVERKIESFFRSPDASLGQPTISFTYTPTGQRASMTDASGTTNYTSTTTAIG